MRNSIRAWCKDAHLSFLCRAAYIYLLSNRRWAACRCRKVMQGQLSERNQRKSDFRFQSTTFVPNYTLTPCQSDPHGGIFFPFLLWIPKPPLHSVNWAVVRGQRRHTLAFWRCNYSNSAQPLHVELHLAPGTRSQQVLRGLQGEQGKPGSEKQIEHTRFCFSHSALTSILHSENLRPHAVHGRERCCSICSQICEWL